MGEHVSAGGEGVSDQTTVLPPVAKTQGIIDALRRMHPMHDGQWCFIDELRLGVGYSKSTCEQRIDAFAVHCWTPYERITYEVKASRSDFLRELKQPRKRARGLMLSNQFYFAAPVDTIKPDEVPPECGLYEVSWGTWESGGRYVLPDGARSGQGTWERDHHEGFVAKLAVPAPVRDTYPPTWNFVAAVMRRMQRDMTKETP